MKINGKKIEGPNIEIIPIMRGDDAIYLKAQAVTDYSIFKKLCPEPVAPKVMTPGRKIQEDVTNPEYLKSLEEYGKKRLEYMILQSLSVTEGLEWETVTFSDSSTWSNYDSELRASGFSEIEIQKIIIGVMSANGLDDSKVEEARKRFLALEKEKAGG